jgi:anion-transporting  ArsA/GET3 family ATPase
VRERLAELVDEGHVVVVVGAGGVGKTTTAAALGVAAARRGRRVLVLTVDPARRLASALGIGSFTGEIQQVRGPGITGDLWASMLDPEAAWRDVVTTHAPDPATRDALLANPLFRTITGRFVHAQNYAAIERLEALRRDERFDLVIVDTPPSVHAVDFLDAPGRMAEFFESRLLRWLTIPSRTRVMSAASKPFLVVADRLLGRRFLRDIADLFELLQQLHEGFAARARAVAGTLADPTTGYVLVTSPEPGPVEDAAGLVTALADRGLPGPVVVANRTVPYDASSARAVEAARRLRRGRAGQGSEVGSALGPDAPPDVDRLLDALLALHDSLHARGVAEDAALARLGLVPGPLRVPEQADAPTDLDGLARLAEELLGEA